MAPPNVTLGELFRQAGYRTGAFTGGVFVGSHFGFGQGFEVYLDFPEEKKGGPGPILEAALRWTRAAAQQPFFLFVHTYEPHTPFTHAELADPSEAGRLRGGFLQKHAWDVVTGKMVLAEPERRYVKDLYDGDVAATDRLIGDFLETLRREGILDDAILVVMSDHGEELWEREPARSPGHAHSLYQELLHVPLLVRWPGHIPTARRVRTPVNLVDLGPTLLDLAGLSPAPQHEGRTLAANLRDGTEPAESLVFSEGTDYGTNRLAVRLGSLKAVHAPSPDKFRNQIRLGGTFLEVFDLASDPGERSNIAGAPDPRVGVVTRAILERARSKNFAGPSVPGDVPEEVLERLRSLGYVN
jgi:arylsulfatase A-like enzyme